MSETGLVHHFFEGQPCKAAESVLAQAAELAPTVASIVVMPDAHVHEGVPHGVSLLLKPLTAPGELRDLVEMLKRYDNLTASTAVYDVIEPRDVAANEASYAARAAALYRDAAVVATAGSLLIGNELYEFGDEESRIVLAYRVSGRTGEQVLVVHSFSTTIVQRLRTQLDALVSRSDATLESIYRLFERAQRQASRQRDALAKAFASSLGLKLASTVATSEDGTTTELLAQPRLQTPTTSMTRITSKHGEHSYLFNVDVSALSYATTDAAGSAATTTTTSFVYFMRPLDGVVIVTASEQHARNASHMFPVSSEAVNVGSKARTSRGVIIAAGGFPEPQAAGTAAAGGMHEHVDSVWRRPLEARFRALMRDADASVLDYVPVFTLLGGVDARTRSIREHLEAATRAQQSTLTLPLDHVFVAAIVPIFVTSYLKMFGDEAVPLKEIFGLANDQTLTLETSLVRNLLDASAAQ